MYYEDENKIRVFARMYRNAIIKARNQHCFDDDRCFYKYPDQCCGDTCYMLAKFLLDYGVSTIYVSANHSQYGTHAWLVVNDDRIPKKASHFGLTDDDYIKCMSALSLYSSNISENDTKEPYRSDDFEKAIIIDITADQFPERKQYEVYVGHKVPFYDHFEFLNATEIDGVLSPRLQNLYSLIDDHICHYH